VTRSRPLSVFDAALLAEMYGASFTAPWDQTWSENSFAEILAMPGGLGWLLIEGEAPIGFLLARFTLDEGEILLTGVLPAARRAGHGRSLMRIVISSARDAGVTRLFLEHADGNAAAAQLYSGLGFAEVGRRAGYYRGSVGGRADAVMRALVLGEKPHA
jgi:ribosomal-protein-alanine N-acetyltransferase